MAQRQAGERIGAMAHADEKTVWMFGYGVYDGRFVPEESEHVQFMGIKMETSNPRLTLDNGKHVYGCECWWGGEEAVKAKIGDRIVVMLDIEEERRKASTAETG